MRFSVSRGRGRKAATELRKFTHVHTCGESAGNAVYICAHLWSEHRKCNAY